MLGAEKEREKKPASLMLYAMVTHLLAPPSAIDYVADCRSSEFSYVHYRVKIVKLTTQNAAKNNF